MRKSRGCFRILAGCAIAAKCCKNHMLYHNSHADEDKPVLIRLVDVLGTDKPARGDHMCSADIPRFRDPVRRRRCHGGCAHRIGDGESATRLGGWLLFYPWRKTWPPDVCPMPLNCSYLLRQRDVTAASPPRQNAQTPEGAGARAPRARRSAACGREGVGRQNLGAFCRWLTGIRR